MEGKGFENLAGNPQENLLAHALRAARTRREVSDAVSDIRQYVVEHRKDAGQDAGEDIDLFIQYCDVILQEGINNPDTFLQSLHWLFQDNKLS